MSDKFTLPSPNFTRKFSHTISSHVTKLFVTQCLYTMFQTFQFEVSLCTEQPWMKKPNLLELDKPQTADLPICSFLVISNRIVSIHMVI